MNTTSAPEPTMMRLGAHFNFSNFAQVMMIESVL